MTVQQQLSLLQLAFVRDRSGDDSTACKWVQHEQRSRE